MKKSAKLFSMFLALVMVFSMLGTIPVSAVWDDEMIGTEQEKDYQKYMQFEGNVLVKYTGTNSRVISLPAGTEIGEGAFKDHTEIRVVWLADDIVKIGKEAFKGCTNLEKVWTYKVHDIGDSAFEGCTRLQYYNFVPFQSDASYYNLGKAAFKGCTNLRGFAGKAVNWEIKAETFANCPNLKVVLLNGSLNKIDPAAFSTITNNGKTVTRTSNPDIFSDAGGNAAENFAKKYGMKFTIGRPTKNYGTYESENAIFSGRVSVFCYSKPIDSPQKFQYIWGGGNIGRYEMGEYNYSILRDVAAECNQLETTKFNIEYMPEENAINIIFGEDYVPNGTECQYIDKYDYIPNTSVTKMPLYFNGQLSNQFAYNIGGKACIIEKDFLQEMNAPYGIGSSDYGGGWFKVDKDTIKQIKLARNYDLD